MTDIVTPEIRSRMMSGIRSKNTKIEISIRKALFALGFRYRINDRNLPGKPDIVLPRYRVVIMVHGCFWHGHNCSLFRLPKSRTEFWQKKITKNRERDALANNSLTSAGWRVATVWECSIRGTKSLGLEMTVSKIAKWLESGEQLTEISGSSATE